MKKLTNYVIGSLGQRHRPSAIIAQNHLGDPRSAKKITIYF